LRHGVELYENGLDNSTFYVAVDIDSPIVIFLLELWIQHCSLHGSRKAALTGERHVGRRDIGCAMLYIAQIRRLTAFCS